MTVPSEVDVIVDTGASDNHSYVDWPAIIAGIVLASAISILLLTFGSAIGLSMTDFDGEGVSPLWIAIAAALWLLWVQVSSFMAGGYVTGRLRRRHPGATEHEVDVRDGTHGLLVWGGALVLGALIAVSGLGSAINTIGGAASTLTTAASNVAGEEGADPTAYFTDMLFRPAPAGGVTAETETEAAAEEPAAAADTPAATDDAAAPGAAAPTTGAATTTTPATSSPATTRATSSPAPAPAATASAPEVDEGARAEAGRIFAASTVAGELPEDDRAYLVQMVASNTGMSDEEAEARVEQVVTSMETARTEAEEAAEAARKTGVLAAFLTAASLLVSAVGAFWAAQKGGQHRDEGTVFAETFRRF